MRWFGGWGGLNIKTNILKIVRFSSLCDGGVRWDVMASGIDPLVLLTVGAFILFIYNHGHDLTQELPISLKLSYICDILLQVTITEFSNQNKKWWNLI